MRTFLSMLALLGGSALVVYYPVESLVTIAGVAITVDTLENRRRF